MRRISHLALAALLCACTEPVTQLVVVVDSDYLPGTELEQVTIESFDPALPSVPRDTVTRLVAGVGDATHVAIPFSFAVVPGTRPADGEVELEITGSLSSGTIIRRVRTRFLPGATAIVRVHLSRACENARTCTVPGTCEHGDCVPLVREPTRVDGLVPGSELDAGPRDGAPHDGDVDGGDDLDGGGDAAPSDGGPRELTCDPTEVRRAFADPGPDHELAYDGRSLVLVAASAPGLVVRTETASFAILTDTNVARPAIAEHPAGWIVSFTYGASRNVVSALTVTDPPDITMTTMYGDLHTSDHPTAIAADGAHAILASAGASGPSYRTLVGTTTWGPETPLEAAGIVGRPAIARHLSTFVYAWADGSTVRARQLLSGTSVDVQPTRYEAPSVAPIAAVDVDVSAYGFATVAWHDDPTTPVVLARFEGTGSAPTLLTLRPEALPIIGPAAVAIDDDGVTAVLVRSELSVGSELRLAQVDALGEVSYALVRTSSARSTRQWIWALGGGQWLVAWDEGPDVYARHLACH